MGVGKFNSIDHYIYYCGQELLGRNGVATKESEMQYIVQSQKQQNKLGSFPRLPFNSTVI